ncbi:hypothetical protein CJF30_00008568 [Rutstroemia sp. NJR-2017a BBW]|nr:hypothetical protein CJF30_00008568 [Rutstroemia sp. NJR-2017a BBW]
MWVLDHDGDVFQDKSISRQHLEITIAANNPLDCANPKSRARVTLKDLNTKIGTTVNGEQIRGQEHVLTKDENEVFLGRLKQVFRFTWVPVALTFSFTSKELKGKPFEELYNTLGPLDIKVLPEYVRGVTTHVVVKKRNTSKGLQALINGKYIVNNDPFTEALLAATRPEEDGTSPLEKDFDANFPDAIQYLPERGSEPTDEPATSYAPVPARANMFEGYTFIFYDKSQFETLLAPITDGRGKALFREVVPFETTVTDFVRYVKDVAGEKGDGSFEDGSEGKGVVVVRYNPVKGDGHEWFQDFGRQVALHLDHRLIEQNEFLDAILKTDAGLLRRPLEIELSGVVASNPAPASSPKPPAVDTSTAPKVASAPPIAKEPVTQNTSVKRSRPRRAVTSRFTGFDLGDDDSASNSIAPMESMQESMDMDRAPDESQGLFVSQDPDREAQDMNTDRQHSQSVEPESVQARTSRKRAAYPIQEESEDESTVKRRRLMDEVARREKEQPAPVIKKEVAIEKKKKDKEKKEIDILALAAQQREKTEAAARAEQESLNETPGNIDINEIRNLTIVEEIEVVRQRPAPRPRTHADESDRWDDKWNGRKNFKKFRRRGADGPLRAPARVIVPLEEVKKKGFGIGDEYWGEDDSLQRRKKKGKGRDTQTQETEEPVLDSSARSRPVESHSRTSRTVVNDEEEDLPENPMDAKHTETIPSEDEEQPSRSRPSQSLRGSSLADKTNASQNLSTQKSTAKRPAASSLTKPVPVKRVRRAMARKEESDDSDSDEDRFKFRR